MLIAVWPLIVMVLGLLVYLLASAGKTVEIGRLTFFVGLFWTVYSLLGKVLRL